MKKNQLGLWYKVFKFRDKEMNVKKINKIFFRNLHKIGYRYFNLKKNNKNDIFLIKSFQKRFIPKKVSCLIDQKTFIISQFLANASKN